MKTEHPSLGLIGRCLHSNEREGSEWFSVDLSAEVMMGCKDPWCEVARVYTTNSRDALIIRMIEPDRTCSRVSLLILDQKRTPAPRE